MVFKRESILNNFIILENGRTLMLSFSKLCKKFSIDSVIRIQQKDYKYINKDEKLFVHFNLEVCNHEKGKIYALPKIIKPGYYKNEDKEKFPVLNFKNCYLGRCVRVRQRVKYSALTKNDFKYSLSNIKDAESLKREMLLRYGKSMPELEKKEIIKAGVSITTLKLIGKIDGQF